MALTLVPRPRTGEEMGAPASRTTAPLLVARVVTPAEPLQLTPHERYLVRTYADILAAWNFGVDLGENAGAGAGAGADSSVDAAASSASARLLRVPQLFDAVFAAADLRDFLARLADAEHAGLLSRQLTAAEDAAMAAAARNGGRGSQSAASTRTSLGRFYYAGIRPPAVARVLNSKACRGAIMFGDPLSPYECAALLERLARTRFPFQCAHGRPSMVPLVTLVPGPAWPAQGEAGSGAGIVRSLVVQDDCPGAPPARG
jgi:DNA mismatch repair ATPase MutL